MSISPGILIRDLHVRDPLCLSAPGHGIPFPWDPTARYPLVHRTFWGSHVISCRPVACRTPASPTATSDSARAASLPQHQWLLRDFSGDPAKPGVLAPERTRAPHADSFASSPADATAAGGVPGAARPVGLTRRRQASRPLRALALPHLPHSPRLVHSDTRGTPRRGRRRPANPREPPTGAARAKTRDT
jgi:hypothetical protein